MVKVNKPPLQSVVVRLPKAMVAEIDRYALEVTRSNLGIPYTRSDAVRALIHMGLQKHLEAKLCGKRSSIS